MTVSTAPSTGGDDPVVPPHPATYSAPIVDVFRKIVGSELAATEEVRAGEPLRILDPFAGLGGIHALADVLVETTGVELEPAWAAAHPRTQVGDATDLPGDWTDRFHAVVTSPCYGNRMADLYDGSRDRCTAGCEDGTFPIDSGDPDDAARIDCDACSGTGLAPSKRYTYRIALGSDLTPGSAAGLQWGPAYRQLHRDAYSEIVRVVRPGGLVVVNVSNHIRNKQIQHVVEWTLTVLFAEGLSLVEARAVPTSRMRNGANHDARVPAEHVLVTRKAP